MTPGEPMRSYVGGCAVEHGQSLVDRRVVDMPSPISMLLLPFCKVESPFPQELLLAVLWDPSWPTAEVEGGPVV